MDAQICYRCIYFIDPLASIIDRKHEARNADIQQHTPPETSPLTADSSDSDIDSDSEPDTPSPGQKKHSRMAADYISLRPSELRTLRRLAPKVNLLPVIARTDSMTDARLRNVKKAVRRELEQAGIGFGVFALGTNLDSPHSERRGNRRPQMEHRSIDDENEVSEPPGLGATPISPVSPNDSNPVDEDSEHTPKKSVIKIRPTRFPADLSRKRSQSRIRKAHMQSNESDEEFEIARAKSNMKESVRIQEQQKSGTGDDSRKKRMSFASMRFYDHTQSLLSRDPLDGSGENAAAQREVDRLLPFALVNPERTSRRRPTSFQPSLDTDADQGQDILETSMFVRKFRWGTIDVLNAAHCDFVPMRTAIFASHLKALRKSTRDAYERYRTEKLLIRKARKMRQSMHPAQDSSVGVNSELGVLGEVESWVDVPAGVKATIPEAGTRNSSNHGRSLSPISYRFLN